MPIKMIRQDITRIKCDAIVDPTDEIYSHSGGTDAAIHKAAGEELYYACLAQGRLSVGRAVITPAFRLPCKYVIHTVGPIWENGCIGEEALLRSCYAECLRLALENGCKSVAFPLISSGTFGFPKDRVLKIAVDEISEFLFNNEMLVYIVVFDHTSYSIGEKLFSDITSYIYDNYTEETTAYYATKSMCAPIDRENACERIPSMAAKSLDDMIRLMDKGFADTLFEYIDEKGITDVECYKRANVDKKTFSKIKCNKEYRPSKVTAVSFAIALRLNIDQTNRLLKTAGMSLSRSNLFDVIIEYFITTGNYKTIYDVNDTLYKFDQTTLGV